MKLKESGICFDGAYDGSSIILALADLISQDIKDKPIIAFNTRNDIDSLSISEQEKTRLKQSIFKVKQDRHEYQELTTSKELQEELSNLSKGAIAKEFDAMFALLEKKGHQVLYTRLIPQDSEIFSEEIRDNFGHWVLLSFFHDHNNKKSILISNPNAQELEENEHLITIINSYLKKYSDVKVYYTRDYLQLDNPFCGPGSIIALRALYDMDKESFNRILQSGQQKNAYGNVFQYTPIELGYDALQKEIGRVPQLAITKTPQTHEGEKVPDKVNLLREKIAQVQRQIDYDTAVVCGKKLSSEGKDVDASLPFALQDIPFHPELIGDGFSEEHKVFLKKVLLSGKNLLTPEQIEQVKENRRKKIEELSKSLDREYSELYKKEASAPVEELVKRLSKKDPGLLSILEKNEVLTTTLTDDRQQVKALNVNEDSKIQPQPIKQNSKESRKLNESLQSEIPVANESPAKEPNVSDVYSFLVIGAIVGAAIAYLAGAATLTPLSAAVATFIVSVAVGALVGYGIGKFCEKVSEKKQNDPDMSTWTAVKSVMCDVSTTERSKPGLAG